MSSRSSSPPPTFPRVGAVLLAGGKNSRMGGRDKAFLHVGGELVVERTLSLLRSCFPQVVVVSNQPEKYDRFAVSVVQDEFPAAGPLAGIHAGLGRIDLPYAFVVACDMPFLRVEPIAFLASLIRAQDAIVPCWDDDIEPLHALYATSLRNRMAQALAAGTHAIREFLPSIQVEYVPEGRMRSVPGAEESFRNVNTPEEAARFDIQPNPGWA